MRLRFAMSSDSVASANRHLVEVDSEQLQMHNLDPALVGAQYEFDDDFVCLDDFVWSSEVK